MKEENPELLVAEIDKFSGNRLKRKEDLLLLIYLGYSGDRKGLVEELSFTAKYVQGLFRVLKQSSDDPGIKNTSLIKRDLSVNLEKVKEKIEALINDTDEKTKKYFKENFLILSQENLQKLMDLMHDLEWTKRYLNNLKRKNPN